MSTLAAIHVGRRQLGLDEETYRGLLERVTESTVYRLLKRAGVKRSVKGKRRVVHLEPRQKKLREKANDPRQMNMFS